LPAGVTPISFDLADPRAADTTVASVVRAAGRLDVLINNAGTGTLGPLEETDDDEAHRILEVNLFGPMRLARAAVPVMRSQGGGRIVNVTSMNDVLPAPFASWYSASKAALASASVVLDAEVHGFGIFVTVVAPGLFRTEMVEGLVSFGIAEGSAYRKTLEGLRAENTVYIAWTRRSGRSAVTRNPPSTPRTSRRPRRCATKSASCSARKTPARRSGQRRTWTFRP
jgi:NAD(P)-dependent dehydrogenase (short-subunit alcohol dehydrogenase family)